MIKDGENLGRLDAHVRMLMLQFSFSERHPMPNIFLQLPDETQGKHTERKSALVTGTRFIEPGHNNVGLKHITESLERAEYVFVSAVRQRRTQEFQSYNMIRFFFARRGYVDPTTNDPSFRKTCRSMLQLIARDTMWRVRAYRNPLCQHDVIVPGECSISINLEARCGLRQNNGVPIMVWPRDAHGRKTGESKKPLSPSQILTAMDGIIQLIPATE